MYCFKYRRIKNVWSILLKNTICWILTFKNTMCIVLHAIEKNAVNFHYKMLYTLQYKYPLYEEIGILAFQ